MDDPEPVTRVPIDLIGQLEARRLMKTSFRLFALLAVMVFANLPKMADAMPLDELESCHALMQGDNVTCHAMEEKSFGDCATMAGCAVLRPAAELTFPLLDPPKARISFDLNSNGAKSAFVPVDYPPPRA